MKIIVAIDSFKGCLTSAEANQAASEGIIEKMPDAKVVQVPVSYVGKANLGAAEQYVSEMYTEADTPYALTVEMSAVNGTFCISLMQRFADDTYLDAFLDKLRQIGISYRIATRHPTTVAHIADYRKNIAETCAI